MNYVKIFTQLKLHYIDLLGLEYPIIITSLDYWKVQMVENTNIRYNMVFWIIIIIINIID